MIRILILPFLVAFGFYSKAQKLTDQSSFGKNIVFGGNYSSLSSSEERLDAALRPFLGFDLEYNLNKNFLLEGAIIYSSRASYFTNSVFLEESGIDVLFAPTIKYDDFRFKAGVSFENPFTSELSKKLDSVSIPKSVETEPESRFNAFVGVEFKLNESFNLFLNHTIPTQAKSSVTFQLGLKFSLSQGFAKQPSYRKKRRKASVRQIKELKKGTLLVRLKTSQNKIDALRKLGREEEAEKVEKNQKEENLKLLKAFKKNYDFSEVQFFYSNQSSNVKSGKLKGIFLNDSLQLDSTIKVENNNIFTAEYTTIEQDTLKMFSHTEKRITGPFRFEEEAVFFGGPNMNFMALVIKNQQFQQMTRPFPYYARFNKPYLLRHPEQFLFGLPLVYLLANPSYNYMVEAMNYKLKRFYKKKTRFTTD